MAWVTWRQHRHQLLIGLALIVALALAALVTAALAAIGSLAWFARIP